MGSTILGRPSIIVPGGGSPTVLRTPGFAYSGGGGSPPPPFDPTSVTGLTLWVRAEELSQSDGQSVSSWADLSGNGNDFSVAGSTPPICKTAIIGGKKVVRFNGVNTTFLTTAVDGSVLFSNSAYTFIVVCQTSAVNTNAPNSSFWTNDTILSVGLGWGGLYFRGTYEAVAGNWDGSADATSKSVSLNTPMIVSSQHGGGSLFLAINDGAQGSVASGNTAGGLNEKFRVGAQNAFALTGDVAEVLVYNNKVSAADLSYLIDGLNTYYGGIF